MNISESKRHQSHLSRAWYCLSFQPNSLKRASAVNASVTAKITLAEVHDE